MKINSTPEVAPTVHRGGLWEFSGVRTTSADMAARPELASERRRVRCERFTFTPSHRFSPSPRTRSAGSEPDLPVLNQDLLTVLGHDHMSHLRKPTGYRTLMRTHTLNQIY